jgi:ATP-dependent DNA helicase RecQ
MAEQTPDVILKNVFGYDTFKPLQHEVIDNVLKRRDTLVIMPTGGGKSLCYQIPALIFPGLTVVVSPLIALMKDQVEQLTALNVPALFLNSSLSMEEYRDNFDLVREGKVKLLYVAPEALLSPRVLGLLSSVPFDCLTIDEAHCISEWGHDFRPEYRMLAEVRSRFPQVVCMALTATATPRVQEDIQNSLKLENSNAFVASFNRENLLIDIVPKVDSLRQVLRFLERYPNQSGIIYCFSRRNVDDLSAALERSGYSVRPYHAGLTDWERKLNQELFIRDDVQIIVATIAFGMGINKPNVRFVIHFDLPKSIESYYQEIGRAGRDGLPAHCMLLYNYGDVQKLKYFIDQKEGNERQVAYQHLAALTRYAETTACRRGPLLTYFGEDYPEDGRCGNCDNCLSEQKEERDISVPAQKFLSCVVRTGERFGAGHVIDVLLGSENQKVLKFSHQTLSTHGIGKELSRAQWMQLSRLLLQKGLLDQDEVHGSLRLTGEGAETLRNRAVVMGFLPPTEESDRPERPRAVERTPELVYDRTLFELLRKKRKELADAGSVPPYVIFSDRTLVEMCFYYPQTVESLMRIHGVGAAKLENFGAIFLDVISEYCLERGLEEKVKPSPAKPVKEKGRNGGGSKEPAEPKEPAQLTLRTPRFVEVAEAYNQGETLEALAERYKVKQETVLEHLSQYAIGGNPIRTGDELLAFSHLPEDVRLAVLSAFGELGVERLKPVFEKLDGAVSYEELKILRLYYLSQNHQ